MADPIISLKDFEDRYHGPVDDPARVTLLLDDASALVREAAGDDFEDGVPAAVVPVVVEAVRRAVDNPAGLDSETIGGYTWRAERSRTGVYLTDAERRTVRRAANRLGVGSLHLEGYS